MSRLYVFLVLLLAIVLTVIGEILLKKGVGEVGEFSFRWSILWRTFTNWKVLLGFLWIFAGSIFWLVVISRIELSVAYPMLGLSYVVMVLASWPALQEPLNWQKVVGSLVICLGVALVAQGMS
jgi:multidrug transporter EmrE-like cation transporter